MRELTKRAQILNFMKSNGWITKAISSSKNYSHGLSEHIRQLRKKHYIKTVMRKNLVTGSAFAVYTYLGKKVK